MKPISLKLKKAAAEAAIVALTSFIGPRQLHVVRTCMRGEEKEFFFDKMIALAALTGSMPKTYGQDGMGDNAIVSLHYFAGGSANWWITEKDAGSGDPADTDTGQHQAFGLANLFGGPTDQDAELGYISIAEIIAHGGELDFHFKPRTLGELKAGREPAEIIGAVPFPATTRHASIIASL